MVHCRAVYQDDCETVLLCATRTGQRICINHSVRVRDEAATWVSEHSVQNNSVIALWANIADIYIYWNFADMIHQEHCHISP